MGKIGKSSTRLATGWPASASHDERVILCPWLTGPDLATSFWLSPLSWQDANGSLLAALHDAAPTPASVFAAIFCVDPFRRPEALFAALDQAGVVGIVNLPSISFLDGAFAETLESFRLGTEREIDFLRRAKVHGFRIAGCAASLASADALCEAGAELIIAHAGPPLPGRSDPAQAFTATLRRHLAGRAVEIIAVGTLLAPLCGPS
jgi:predicted TIM-barrel enzyme